ncbi:DUF3617 family protein [Sphingomonas sp. HMP6]|uniref:DUF3617 family protein n=1 Tax=Sphingomonas sp. HMP6 TaxID=1517551 RepID=UPI0015966CB3|nr:DUF3617 family protein [Sphingomonas sp. HMP6]BCA60700.1 hypothetical protein HMP06_3469 [Sphingomonas sp. HMP6]
MITPFRLAALTVCIAVLHGCGPAQKSLSAAPEILLKRQPGSWTFESEILAFDATGMSGDIAEMAKAGKAAVGTKNGSGPACLEAKTVSDDSFKKRLQEAIQFGPEWKVQRSSFEDGKVDFKATMRSVDQGDGEMTIVGTISPTLTDLTLVTTSNRPGGGTGSLRTTIHTRNARVGACTAGEDTLG